MRKSFTDSFKIQAIEKALNRQEGISIKDVAEKLRYWPFNITKVD